VAEFDHHDAEVPATAWFIAIRHRIKYMRGRARQTAHRLPRLPVSSADYEPAARGAPMEVWCDYNGRAAWKDVIKELDAG
jgi:hypothetical protein